MEWRVFYPPFDRSSLRQSSKQALVISFIEGERYGRRVLLLRGADAGRSPVDLHAVAGVLQRPAVPGKDPVVLLDHVADENRLAIRRPRRSLRPVTDRRLGDARERFAAHTREHELARVVVEGRVLGTVAAVVDDDGDDRAVRCDLQAFGGGPSTPIVSTTRGGLAVRSMRLTLSLSPVVAPMRLPT